MTATASARMDSLGKNWDERFCCLTPKNCRHERQCLDHLLHSKVKYLRVFLQSWLTQFLSFCGAFRKAYYSENVFGSVLFVWHQGWPSWGFLRVPVSTPRTLPLPQSAKSQEAFPAEQRSQPKETFFSFFRKRLGTSDGVKHIPTLW